MALDISKCFESTSDYERFSDKMFRYTRSKLTNESIPDKDTLNEIARDIATDAIVSYLAYIDNGGIVNYKITYVKTSIDNVLKSPKFIKQKENIRAKVIVFNSSEESTDKASFNRWVEENNTVSEENTENYHHKLLSIIGEDLNATLTQLDLRIVELMDIGLSNREIAVNLNFSEGYVSKLIKKIRAKMLRNHFK